MTSFGVLFPRRALGGMYAIEDLVWAYLRDYGGWLPGTPRYDD